jgi:hypothetical protein
MPEICVPHNVSGRLDRLQDGVLEGWAVHPEDECPTLDVLIDGTPVGTVKAGLYREDLAQANLRRGYAKFLYTIPAHYSDGRPHSIDLRHAGTSLSIYNMPTSFTLGAKRGVDWAERPLPTRVLNDQKLGDDFANAVRRTKRVALVSTFGNAKRFMLHQQALFRSLVDAGFIVVVVHTSKFCSASMNTTAGPHCYTIIRRGAGCDFGAWAVGTAALDALLGAVDEVLLLSDSVIALESGVLGELLAQARAMGADAVGVTESYERQYHLQSHFVWLGPQICHSSFLPGFMAGLAVGADGAMVTPDRELSLTARLRGEGFSVACLHPYEQVAQKWLGGLDQIVSEIQALPKLSGGCEVYKTRLLENLDQTVALVLDGTPVNPGHFFWDTLVERCDCRLVKRDLVIFNPCRVPTYYRLGPLFAGLPDARRMLLDLRQLHGGTLIPAFWTGGTETQLLEPNPSRHSATIVPFGPVDRHDGTGIV